MTRLHLSAETASAALLADLAMLRAHLQHIAAAGAAGTPRRYATPASDHSRATIRLSHVEARLLAACVDHTLAHLTQ
jgi:hypothetical protein